jgi:RNA polymerase sigma factor (sigma-70 family)
MGTITSTSKDNGRELSNNNENNKYKDTLHNGVRKRLSVHQKKLTEKYTEIGEYAAKVVRSRMLSYEEKVAAGYYGVCVAALTWNKNEDGPFETYAKRSAKWAIWNDIRSLSRWRRWGIEQYDNEQHHEPAIEHSFDRIEYRDEVAQMSKAIKQLTPRHKLVIHLRINGYSWEEIGIAMNIKTITAASVGRRAFDRLRFLFYKENYHEATSIQYGNTNVDG